MDTLLIFVKYPTPGKVKTRLGREIGLALAARFYEQFVEQTIDLAQKASHQQKILFFDPEVRRLDFEKMLPSGFELIAQPDGDLGARLKFGFSTSFSAGSKTVTAIGTDSPTLPLAYLNSSLEKLKLNDAVVGPASDGGYYLIGLSKNEVEVFSDIEWSSKNVLSTTLARFATLNLSHVQLPEWYDVDTLEGLEKAAGEDASGRLRKMLNEIEFGRA